jgi:hypothetical protein
MLPECLSFRVLPLHIRFNIRTAFLPQLFLTLIAENLFEIIGIQEGFLTTKGTANHSAALRGMKIANAKHKTTNNTIRFLTWKSILK